MFTQDRWTDATKYIISLASWSIITLQTALHTINRSPPPKETFNTILKMQIHFPIYCQLLSGYRLWSRKMIDLVASVHLLRCVCSPVWPVIRGHMQTQTVFLCLRHTRTDGCTPPNLLSRCIAVGNDNEACKEPPLALIPVFTIIRSCLRCQRNIFINPISWQILVHVNTERLTRVET